MLTNNHSIVNQVNTNTGTLFTANAMKWNTQQQSTTMQAQRPAHQNTASALNMSMGGSKFAAAFNESQRRAPVPVAFAAQESSSFMGTPAPVTSQPMMSMAASNNSKKTKMDVSMFGGAPASNIQVPSEPSIMGSLGNSVNMARQPFTVSKVRTSSVIMMAAPTVEGDTDIKQSADHMDRVMLQQKYDNADHLDPVLHYTGNKYIEELMTNAKLLSQYGKGILASDESNGTCGKRFEAIGVKNEEENRRAYRELLYTAPGLSESVSGAIMYDETIRQSCKDGTPFTKYLADNGILTGIKVDTGISLIEGTNDETVTNGLDGLPDRCAEYYKLGARFAKWRAVLKITDDGCPSQTAITETAHSLARYAQICQHAGLVPIVEPEILTDGTHSIKKCARVSEKVFNAVMNEIIKQNIMLEGMLLKPNMITSGAQADTQAGPEEVAFFTVRTLGRTIPPAVPGITFLSGGQSEETASLNLNAINKLAEIKHPWNMTFSFGRALQSSVLQAWQGKTENVEEAQKRLVERCDACGEAAKGTYKGGDGSTASDYVANYVY